MPNVINLEDAPSGDLSLDDIFGESSSAQTTVEPVTNEPQPTQTTTTQVAEPVIKTKTGTVYKSIEDAVEGIEHKDALIAQLRDQVKRETGSDPLTRRPEPTQPNGPKNYMDDQEQYFNDLSSAVEKQDRSAYMQTQRKLIWDSLGPLAPTITSLAKANAERVVSDELPEFREYVLSDDYRNLEQYSPLLADAIRTAEANPQAGNQLPELYRIAYLSSQGRKVPELLQSVRSDTSTTQSRPTVHSTQVSPPPVTGVPQAQPSLDSKEGRAAIIKQMEDRGIGNQRW
jgi:hypothetical protein